ncbi:MAG: hypothetical protein CL883_03175 [Dehalococcoidia bacterium]|nr:hypothetical protein [Dehalococcoidia bacterium]
MNYSELKPDQIISTQQFSLDRPFIDDYLKSTSESTDGIDTNFAPPMSLGALAVRAAITDLEIPGGTLHLTQEVEFFGPFPIGETISCSAKLLQNSVRAGMRILVIGLLIKNSAGLQLMSGKSTITVPN